MITKFFFHISSNSKYVKSDQFAKNLKQKKEIICCWNTIFTPRWTRRVVYSKPNIFTWVVPCSIHKLKLALKCTLDGISKMMHFSCKNTFMAQNLYLSKIPRNTYCKSFYLWFIKKNHDSNVIIHRELYMYLHSG